MSNMFTMIGRIVSDQEINETENGVKFTTITLAVLRSFKNEEGAYDTDFIQLSLFGNLAINTSEYCKKGDLVGAKGRIQCLDGKVELIAEKISFLSSTKKEN